VKHRIGIAAALFAVLVGGGVALAEDGSEAPEEELIEQPAPEVDEVDDDADEVDDEVDDEADEETDTEADAEATDNHGAVVSQAAHDCPTGPGGVHGACVSAVARDKDQDGVPDHGPGSDVDDTDDADDADDDSDDADDTDDAPAATGNGNGNTGNGQGNGGGRGHGRGR
jgi:hypothetical protein